MDKFWFGWLSALCWVGFWQDYRGLGGSCGIFGKLLPKEGGRA